ncbi:MAG: sensor histidine kinase [Solirubrobacteraceae bacterium]
MAGASVGRPDIREAIDGLATPVVLADSVGRPIALNTAAAQLAPDGLERALPGDLLQLASLLDNERGEEVLVIAVQSLDAALRAPDEQAESRRQLNEAQAVAHIGSWTWDTVSSRISFSDEQYRLYGLEPQPGEADLEEYLHLIHAEDRKAMRRAVARAFSSGEPFVVEHRLADDSAGTRWIEGRCEVVMSAGRVVRMVGTCHDITDRKRYEQSLRDSLSEVRASRIRIVEAADEERKRVERDLHDGAQQRLVALSMRLRLARTVQAERSPEVTELLEELAGELQQALAELRDLARGIHPAVLTEQGLARALESLVLRSPLPAQVTACPERRLPAAVEIGVYYLVAEALTNAIKHAGANSAQVSVSEVERGIVVQVCDDGAGGASIDEGSGLRGLADRVAALDGRLTVHSPREGGTTLTAEIPCA